MYMTFGFGTDDDKYHTVTVEGDEFAINYLKGVWFFELPENGYSSDIERFVEKIKYLRDNKFNSLGVPIQYVTSVEHDVKAQDIVD